jgi:hypothetical protein
MRRQLCGLLTAALLLGACATVREVEESNLAPPDPDLAEGQYELDDELCWQGAKPPPGQPADPASFQEAHDACMREKGWKGPPEQLP